MVGHGPDADAFKAASVADLKPVYLPADSLAFMFESTYTMRLTPWALNEAPLDRDYYKCWQQLPKLFNGRKDASAKDLL